MSTAATASRAPTDRGSDTAFVFPAPPGRGGLGALARDILAELATDSASVSAYGPPPVAGLRIASNVRWVEAPRPLSPWITRYTWLRWYTGQQVLRHYSRIAGWAARELASHGHDRVYAMAEVALETMQWAHANHVPAVLDGPTGDIRHYRDAARREHETWAGGRFRAHPSDAMVDRTVEEYALADRIRVASTFSRRTMVDKGVPADKIDVVPYRVDVEQFRPAASPRPAVGPLRVAYVGTLMLPKGFQYLLAAARRVGGSHLSLRLHGGTDSRGALRVLERERRGLDVHAAPAPDLVRALHEAELLVLPSLHDGFGFVVAEAMACGIPVIVTDACGSADLVTPGEDGWIVPAGDAVALAGALEVALDQRSRLHEMGRAARAAAERHSETPSLAALLTRAGGATRDVRR